MCALPERNGLDLEEAFAENRYSACRGIWPMIDLAVALFSSLALAAAVTSPSPLPLVTGPAPLRVTACRLAIEHHGPRGPVQQIIVVSFSNDRDAPADVARFTVSNAGGVAKAFTARGSFTKGVLIADRILPAEALRQELPPSRDRGSVCALTYVHFVDGTSWTGTP
jgi:hypothetical protein